MSFAAEHRMTGALGALLQNGADQTIPDRRGRTPRQWAVTLRGRTKTESDIAATLKVFDEFEFDKDL